MTSREGLHTVALCSAVHGSELLNNADGSTIPRCLSSYVYCRSANPVPSLILRVAVLLLLLLWPMFALVCWCPTQSQYIQRKVLPSVEPGGLPALVVSHGLAIKW